MKPIRIICEEACQDSPYCKQVLSGLLKELKKRRCSFEKIYNAKNLCEEEAVILLGLGRDWFDRMIGQCNEYKITPIVLSSCSSRVFAGRYHLVCAGTGELMKTLYEACLNAGRTNIALYGVDHAGDADMDRMRNFLSLVKDSGNIYLNSGNLEACFQTFYPHADRYDTVLCVNGYAAVSLVRKLEKINPEILDRIVVISCEEVLRNSRFNSRILFLDLNFETYGAAALQIFDMVRNVDHVLEITLSVKGTICEIPERKAEETAAEDEEIYEDPEVIMMARIDQLMIEADQLDHEILAMMMSGNTYAEIAECCYMTEGNVKYRVKKYMTICQVKTKKELLEMLLEYLQ